MNNQLDSTYIILTSDGSLSYYPDNKPNSFSSLMAAPIKVEGNLYEIGLVEASFAITKKLFGYYSGDNIITVQMTHHLT